MTRYTILFCGAALAAIGTRAFAGEDSTDRWHGFGPAWYEVDGGLRRFAAGDPYQANTAGTKKPATKEPSATTAACSDVAKK